MNHPGKLSTAVLWVALLVPALARAAEDPMDFAPPKELPAIKPAYDGAEYQNRCKVALEKLDLKNVPDDEYPERGLIVTDAPPESIGANAGLAVGDIITQIEDQDIYGWESFALATESNRPHKFTVWNRGKTRQFMVPPGFLGVDAPDFPDRLFRYLRGNNRDPKWDDAVTVALFSLRNDDLPLALQALQAAHAAGYDDEEYATILTRTSLRTSDYDSALAAGLIALRNPPPDEKLRKRLLEATHDAALLNFKLEQALQLEKDHPGLADRVSTAKLARLIKRYRALPKADSAGGTPIERAEKLPRVDVTSRLRSDDLKTKWTFSTPAGRGGQINTYEPLANFDLSLDYHLARLTEPDKREFQSALTVRFSTDPRTTDDADEHSQVLLLRVARNNEVEIVPRVGPPVKFFPWPNAVAAADGAGSLRVVLYGRAVEVTINGRRVYHGPVLLDPDQRRVWFSISTNGIDGTVENFRWQSIGEPPPKEDE